MKIGIVGSRGFGDLTRVGKFVELMHEQYGDSLEIVSGGAKGVDKASVDRGLELGLTCTVFRPEGEDIIDNFRAQAMARNTRIVEYSDWVYAFWDLTSTGSLDTIQKALVAQKLVGIYVPHGSFVNTRIEGPA